MPSTDSVPPLAALEVAASGGPYRQFTLRLQDGTTIYATFQAADFSRLDPVPARPTDTHIHEAIATLASARAFR